MLLLCLGTSHNICSLNVELITAFFWKYSTIRIDILFIYLFISKDYLWDLGIQTVILPVLYESVTWSRTQWGEHRLRVFENGVVRKIFGPKRDEITGDWRIKRNEELRTVYCSPYRYYSGDTNEEEMSWAWHVIYWGEGRCIQGFCGETWGKETSWKTQS